MKFVVTQFVKYPHHYQRTACDPKKEIIPSCSWVWVDCFHSIWYDSIYLEGLRKKGFKVAIVSPELHKRKENKNEILKIKNMIGTGLVDAICTDYPESW